jgi:pyrroline-5-carboxylate reductase
MMNSGPQLPTPTWFVGCGNLGGAMVEGWRAAGVDLSSAAVIRPSGMPVEGVRTVTTFAEAGAPPKLLVLAFKPQKLEEIAPHLRYWLTSRTTVLSLLAGVAAGSHRQRFPAAGSILRATTSLPVAVRRGVSALYSEDAEEPTRQQIGDLFSALGFAMWANDESRLATIGAVSGAGPAYVARFIDALAKAGEARGLSREIAATIALETVLGTAWMAATNGEDMASIARRVASPNGTTEAGLKLLDGDGALDKLVQETIEAAARRGRQLAEEAKAPLLAEGARLH